MYIRYFIFILSLTTYTQLFASPISDAQDTYKSTKSSPVENNDAREAFNNGNNILKNSDVLGLITDDKLKENIEATNKRIEELIPQLHNDIQNWVESSRSKRNEVNELIKHVRNNQKQEDARIDTDIATKDTVDIGEMVRRYGSASASMIKGEAPRESIPPLLLFVSMSMPGEMLEQYAKQAADAGGVLVLRGLVGNSMRQTVAALQSLVDKTGAKAFIDPTLYTRFKITRVPTIVMTDGVITPCTPDDDSCNSVIPIYDLISGNITLQYALQQFASSGQTSTLAMQHLVTLQRTSSSTFNDEHIDGGDH